MDTFEEAGEYELPYISKSRVMTWMEVPEHFRFKYLEDIKEPETDAMKRGTRIHESFERYYEHIQGDYTDRDRLTMLTLDEMVDRLPDDTGKWADFIEPFISNFFRWEKRRWEAVDDVLDFRPVSIEEELWRDPLLGLDAEPEWMGLADVILPAASIEEVDSDDGVVVVDFKTGSVPREKYRDDGIYTELEYYVWLFEEKYNVVGAAAYYPRTDELLVQPQNHDHRNNIKNAVAEMVPACDEYDGSQKFEIDPGPLCGWSPEDGDRSAYYGLCSRCTWNVPVDNRNTFEAMLDEGYPLGKIADELGTTANACGYWRYKLGLQ